VVAHTIFPLLVYSLIHVYLNVAKLNELANKTMEALRYEESLGKNATIMHARLICTPLGLLPKTPQ